MKTQLLRKDSTHIICYNLREEKKQIVTNSLIKLNALQCLRGSWLKDDFHFSTTLKTSFSDLDLVCPGPSLGRIKLLQNVNDTLYKNAFLIRVSVHKADSLLKMSIEDSRVLNIGEYLSKVINNNLSPDHLSYIRAKMILLLLRINTGERYIDVANRINTYESYKAYRNKIGIESDFSLENAHALLLTSQTRPVKLFLYSCILSNPTEKYTSQIINHLTDCKSIERWLQKYLIAKIQGYIT